MHLREARSARPVGQHQGAGELFADDGYFGGGDFEADEFVAGVEIEMDFEVGGGGFQGFVGFSAGGGCASGFDSDGARS